ncbi:hypothetical protein OF83DRAFT_1161187 [Amylostereum chailletii]|nr:hypothetical protein OF83DRAFT_1161187 [Amylostereum chailletii]
MSSTNYPEQDAVGGDDLPTYDDLAERHGANSRFGRWRSWIEKRAAERYAETPPEEFERRRQRGWGDARELPPPPPLVQLQPPTPLIDQYPIPPISTTSSSHPRLSVQTLLKDLPEPPVEPFPEEYSSVDSHPLVAQRLSPTHLCLNQFGSRFLPHATAPIRTLLPLLGDQLLLIGHDEGLSVLNLFPQDWGEEGLVSRGPADAQAHPIWTGEGVFQLSILEVEDTGETIPRGVVLALVGQEVENSKDDNNRTLRMYNLASLVSLAKWAIANKGSRPLDLRRPSHWSPQQPTHRKNRASGSFARGIKSLISDSQQQSEPSSSYHNLLPSPNGLHPNSPDGSRSSLSRTDTDSGWDMVDDLPIRWAADFVPLATPGSRLSNVSVISFDMWRDIKQFRGNTLLAVATKSSVLLYESPKGERAFRFLKDFYTPVPPRSILFVNQNAQDAMSRSPSDAGSLAFKRSSYVPYLPSPSSKHGNRHASTVARPVNYGQQLSLFVVFEKKAGLIRLVDSAVGEVELYEDPFIGHQHSRELTLSSPLQSTSSLGSHHGRRSRASADGFAFIKESKGHWITPAQEELPVDPVRSGVTRSVYFLTRGTQTHVLPCPLPSNIQTVPPIKVVFWNSPPTGLSSRIVRPDDADGQAYLQLIASGEDGLEVQEMSLTSLLNNGKGKGPAEEPRRSETDFGGDTGLLCQGGHWDRPFDSPLSRSYSATSSVSYNSLETEEVADRLQREQGLYGWQRKGLADWRVFWVGGSGRGSDDGHQS